MNKCPCEKCISLAICNNIIRDMPKPEVTRHSERRQCCDLQEYLGVDEENRRPLYQDQINTTRKLFGLPPMSFQ